MTRTPTHCNSRAHWEALGICCLTLFGGIVRSSHLDQLSLSHFDEGVYALSGLWSLQDPHVRGFYVGQVFYSPPLYPILIGLQYFIFGAPSDLGAIFPSLISGIATIPLVWWVTRRWYGPQAGMAAAAFASTNLYHIGYSRMALTDVLFGVTVLGSSWLSWEIVSGFRGTWRTLCFAVALALLSGAALLTKYNGALVLVIGGVGGGISALRTTGPIARFPKKRLLVLALGLLAGCALYVPWFLYVEQTIGYGTLLTHQMSYSAHSPGWFANLSRHFSNMAAADGWLNGGGFLLGLLIVHFTHQPGPAWKALAADFLALGSGLIVLGTDLVFVLLTTYEILCGFRKMNSVHLTWFMVFGLLTPFYRPYARLWLPLEIVLWIGAARAIARTVDNSARRSAGNVKSPLVALFAPGAALGIALGLSSFLAQSPRPAADPSMSLHRFVKDWLSLRRDPQHRFPTPWQQAQSLRQALLTTIPPRSDELVLTRGCPPALFFLYLDGRTVLPVRDQLIPRNLRASSLKLLIVLESASLAEPAIRSALERERRNLVLISAAPYRPGLASMLDSFSAWEILFESSDQFPKNWSILIYKFIPH